MSVISKIKSNPKLKKLALSMLIPTNEHRPRLWVRLFLNPFKHKKGAGSIIRSRTRLDVFPFNQFVLGKKSVIEDFATVNNGVGDVIIGDGTIIGIGNVVIGPVNIGNNVMLAQNIVISGLNHNYKDVTVPPAHQNVNCKEITISDDVWIGSNSVITAGVTLGKHCIIGAGSVVTKSVPEYSVAVGNPAKVIKKYNQSSGLWEKFIP
ncbi:acyltransferase [Pedobacter rhodius]|uniref:Acyltransferase n=1 Tax=Pedobacter rhodius TaxID=3004098 RepID=A0ABT4KW78_9SPHI|nr:acyltransferase [Pedobacter sp. SJ11]MCZ4223006.1 acyltransferase [Pedobacter sp. SJ11]